MTITYKQIEPDVIQTSETHADGSYTSGVIHRNETRTRTVQDGTEEVQTGTEQVQVGTEQFETGVDEEGNPILEEYPIFEEQPVFETQPAFITETFSPWDELDVDLVEWLDVDAYNASKAAENALQVFKASRQSMLDNAVVDANGFLFDADEVSISRMANAIIALSGQPDTYALQWSLADTETGVMTNITLVDIKLAHSLAVQNMANIWSI